MRRDYLHFSLYSQHHRVLLLGGLMFLGILVLIFRAYTLQIENSGKALKVQARQTLRRIRIPARRGRILSSDQVILADNEPGFSLLFYPGEMRFNRRRKTIDYMLCAAESFSRAIGKDSPLTRERITLHLNTKPGLPLVLFSRLSPQEAARLYEEIGNWRGVDLESETSRCYPGGRLACHLVGYTGIDLAKKPQDKEDFFYYIPDTVGRNGVEQVADLVVPGTGIRGLRGTPGSSLIRVDHLGFARNEPVEKSDPVDGNHIVLTLDSRAQRIAEDLLDGSRGAIVVLDAANGDILAAASSPGYDLAKFVPVLPRAYYDALQKDPDRPLIHRAFQGSFTPGSIVKPLVCLGYQTAGLSPYDKVLCDGFNEIGNAVVRCAAYRRGGHGEMDMMDAIKHSCNSFMIQNMLMIGKTNVCETMRHAGIGRKTGVEIGESAGIFPSEEVKMRRFRTRWNAYDSALLSIGQGIIEVTPLQAALFAAAIANGGTVWRPHLIKNAVDPYGNILFTRPVVAVDFLDGTPEMLKVIRDGMDQVVNAPGGSGRRAALEGLKLCGKTGSAEIGKKPNLRINAWFIAFTTYKKRTYSIAVLQENARSGGSSCAPLASEFFRQYLLNAPKRADEELSKPDDEADPTLYL